MDAPRNFWYYSNMEDIRNYNLYGEQSDFPDVVHCETIEARSRIHDWEFKPHRHARLHQFLLMESGGGEVMLDEKHADLTPGDLVSIPEGTVHGFQFLPGSTGWVVTLASELVEDCLLDGENLRPLLKTPFIAKHDSGIRRAVKSIFAEYPMRSFARAHILRALSAVLIGLAARAYAKQAPRISATDHGLQRRFETLLEAHFAEHLSVAEYAERLGVTSTHLSRILRHATGQSASAEIEARLIREARRNLAFSNLTIAEIGYQLGYSDPAYFSRVFKRATGRSPRDFRKSLEG